MSKITIVGISGAGKTCYMIGMLSKMLMGVDGFTLTSSKDFQKLKRLMQRLCDKRLPIADRFPAGSDQVEIYSLSLKYALKELEDIEWIDYPGGNFSDNDLDDEINRKFCEHVISSNCLLLCVNGDSFTEGDEDEIIQKISLYEGGYDINQLLSAVSERNNGNLPRICVIVTKYDKIPDYLRTQDMIYRVVHKVFPVLFESTDFNQRIVSICPVSLGKNFDTEGILNPFNIELPILFATFFQKLNELEFVANEIQLEESNLSNLSGGLIKNWWNDTERTTAQKNISIYQNRKEELIASLQKIKEKLGALPMYVNGRELKINDI